VIEVFVVSEQRLGSVFVSDFTVSSSIPQSRDRRHIYRLHQNSRTPFKKLNFHHIYDKVKYVAHLQHYVYSYYCIQSLFLLLRETSHLHSVN